MHTQVNSADLPAVVRASESWEEGARLKDELPLDLKDESCSLAAAGTAARPIPARLTPQGDWTRPRPFQGSAANFKKGYPPKLTTREHAGTYLSTRLSTRVVSTGNTHPWYSCALYNQDLTDLQSADDRACRWPCEARAGLGATRWRLGK